LPNIEGELHEQQKREMVAGSCRAVLSGSGGVCHSGHPPTMRRLQGAGAGGWLPSDLPSRSWPHMFRGHVPTIQASKAHAIVNSAGKKKGGRFAGMFTRKVGLFFTCFGPASDVTDGSSAGALTPGRRLAGQLGSSNLSPNNSLSPTLLTLPNSPRLSFCSEHAGEELETSFVRRRGRRAIP
jgi:hypothetical protein